MFRRAPTTKNYPGHIVKDTEVGKHGFAVREASLNPGSVTYQLSELAAFVNLFPEPLKSLPLKMVKTNKKPKTQNKTKQKTYLTIMVVERTDCFLPVELFIAYFRR